MIRGAVLRRLTSHELVIDWLPVFLVAPILVLDAGISSYGKPLTPVNVLAAFVGCLPLVLRRRVTFPVQAPLLVGGAILVVWQLHCVSTVVVIPMIALFELALRGDRRRSLWMSLAVIPCVLAGVLPSGPGPLADFASVFVRNLALCLLAIAAGDLLRARREAAQREFAAREQETMRRMGEERLRIAREIHDLVAHAMTAINVQAGVAAHLLERDPGQAHGALRAIKDTSGAALNDLRSTLEVLRDPSQTAPLGPAAGLDAIPTLTDSLRGAGVAVALELGAVGDLPSSVQSAGYRIVQEALTNVARHARATHASVRVSRLPERVTIEVVDDGPAGRNGDQAVTGIDGGNGIRGMRERASALGGTLAAQPLAGGGFRVAAVLPTRPSDRAGR